MDTDEVRVAILRMEGTNCEQELFNAFEYLGSTPELIHINQLTSDGIAFQQRRSLEDYQILMFPGGFSGGDYVRAGVIFASRLKSRLLPQLVNFIEEGKAVGGICNGFQVLVELGLLPAFDSVHLKKPNAVLAVNNSNRYECRPTRLKLEKRSAGPFTGMIPQGALLTIPSAHAEGCLTFESEEQEKTLSRLVDNDQIVFRYVDVWGNYSDYPWNPNGSLNNIAGICNPAGNVFGLMPHPERVFFKFNHPDWTREGEPDGPGDGRGVFVSVIDYIQKNF